MKFFGKTLKIETRNNFNNFLFPAGLFLKEVKKIFTRGWLCSVIYLCKVDTSKILEVY